MRASRSSAFSTATKWHRSALLSFVPIERPRRDRHRLGCARSTSRGVARRRHRRRHRRPEPSPSLRRFAHATCVSQFAMRSGSVDPDACRGRSRRTERARRDAADSTGSASRRRGSPLRQRARPGSRDAALGRAPAVRRRPRRPARGRARAATSHPSPSTRGRSTSGCIDSRRPPPPEPRPLPRRVGEACRSRACSTGFRRASSTGAPASSCSRSTRSSSSPRWPPTPIPALRRARAAAARSPTSSTTGCAAGAATEYTNATTTQCLDAHERRRGRRDLLERLGVPHADPPRGRPAGARRSAALAAEAAEADRTASRAVVATATHDTASAVAGVPIRGRRARVPQRRHVVARRRRDRRPVIDDRRVSPRT